MWPFLPETNFRERRLCELRRIPIPRTWVNGDAQNRAPNLSGVHHAPYSMIPTKEPKVLSNLVRWSGLAAMVGGVLYALFMFFHPPNEPAGMDDALWVPVHVVWLVSILLILLGLVGLYVRYADLMGSLGLVAFLVAFFGNALLVAGSFIDAFVLPTLALKLPEVFEAPRFPSRSPWR
jgi:hypothetical protein